MTTQVEHKALDIEFLNRCIDFIEHSTKKAYNLYLDLDAKKHIEKEEWTSLNTLYDEISNEIQKYFKEYEVAQENPGKGYLNAWLYKQDNIDKLNLISWFLDETRPPKEGE